MVLTMYQAYCLFFHPKLSDLVLLVMPNACDTSMQRYLRFVQWHRICKKKERDPICLCANENAQLHSTCGIGQWPRLTGRNPTRRSQLVS